MSISNTHQFKIFYHHKGIFILLFLSPCTYLFLHNLCFHVLTCFFAHSTYTFKFVPTSFHSTLSLAIIYASSSQDISLIYPHTKYPAQIKMAVIFTDFFPNYLEKRLCQHPAIDDNASRNY